MFSAPQVNVSKTDAPKVKVCGIRTAHDAGLALKAGADYLGLIFVPQTPRTLIPHELPAIQGAAQYKAPLVGVFQNQAASLINELATTLPLHWVQLHGEESPEFCKGITRPVMKVFSLLDLPQPETLQAYQAAGVETVLFDWPKGRADAPEWKTLALPALPVGMKAFVAGKLTVTSLSEAIEVCRPYGVDVASGVESQVGMKDWAKLEAFIRQAKSTPSPLF
jgi:phosphoribosylanthranilate isomerase